MGALDHIRVCDFGGQLAGAGATKLLAMFGAEVIRVEDPTNEGRWDTMRVVRVEGVPIHFSETDWTADKPGPLLGEHNERIFVDLLGVEPAELDRQHKDGVI
jgi:crotonobetainyl-CoA:carnitine CoA-transferase CaiB-like acyl-CoA transferase